MRTLYGVKALKVSPAWVFHWENNSILQDYRATNEIRSRTLEMVF